MTGICIISFDCEGKWGVADHVNNDIERSFTNKNLINSYNKINKLLEKFSVQATFAFVGAFTQSKDSFADSWLEPMRKSKSHSNWLKKLLDNFEKEENGWFCEECYEIIKNSNISHEITSHSFTHTPFVSYLNNKDSVDLEFRAIQKWAEQKNLNPETFIFPRNEVNYTNYLKDLSYYAYRGSMEPKTYLGKKVKNIISELNLFGSSEDKISSKIDGLYKIPGGFFLNWRFGLRSFVPLLITQRKFKNSLLRAEQNNEVVHIWMHPHNFINGKDQYELFERCLNTLSEFSSAGKILIMTQEQYLSKVYKI